MTNPTGCPPRVIIDVFPDGLKDSGVRGTARAAFLPRTYCVRQLCRVSSVTKRLTISPNPPEGKERISVSRHGQYGSVGLDEAPATAPFLAIC